MAAVKGSLNEFSSQYRSLYQDFFLGHFSEEQLTSTAAALQSEDVRAYLRCMRKMDCTLGPQFQALCEQMLRTPLGA